MKIRCACNHVISTVTAPNPDGFLLLTERDADTIETEAPEEARTSAIFDRINDLAVQGYRCPSCGRLLLFEQGRGKAPILYKREEI